MNPMSAPSASAQHDSFLRLYTEHEPALRGFVRSLVSSREDAREVMQELAVALWRKFESLADPAQFRAWAFGMARMQVLAWRRDQARDRHFFGEEAMTIIAEQAERMSTQLDAQREALEDCVAKLPADQRSLVSRAYAPGVRIDDLAAQLGRSAMAVYKTLHRIRIALVECTRATLAKEGLS